MQRKEEGKDDPLPTHDLAGKAPVSPAFTIAPDLPVAVTAAGDSVGPLSC